MPKLVISRYRLIETISNIVLKQLTENLKDSFLFGKYMDKVKYFLQNKEEDIEMLIRSLEDKKYQNYIELNYVKGVSAQETANQLYKIWMDTLQRILDFMKVE